jgi:ADP-heptose:LPS heptosyltransferase
MPVRSIEQLIQEVERHSTWALVTANPNSIRHEQVLDWSKASSSFEDFAHIMSVCDASLSVDTAAYYIADALDVFSIAFFTNNLGTVWADPYPRVTPIQVGEPGPLGTLHGSTDPNLIAYADKLWTPAHIKVAVDMLAELFSSL